MDARTLEQVRSWDSRSLSGRPALSALGEQDFSGAVEAGDAWAFLLNGRVVGTHGGDLTDVEAAADGATAYEAPHRSLPLLFSMLGGDGDVRGRYYTEDTPLSEVADTLSSGSFTGYVELSENVLSGDYYLVFYGGRQMAAAFVGSSDQVYTGDEAFERAADEVGIYRVVTASVDVEDLPEPEPESESESDAGAAGAAGVAGASAATDDGQASTETPESPSEATDAAGEETDEAVGDRAPRETPESASAATADEAADAEPSPARTADEAGGPVEETADAEPSTSQPAGERDATESTAAGGGSADASDGTTERREALDTPDGADVFSDEQQWRQTRRIPSLDPDETAAARESAGPTGEDDREGARSSSAGPEADRPAQSGAGVDREPEQRASGDRSGSEDSERVSELEERVERLRTERDDLRERRDELAAERDRHRERASELEAELDEVRAELEAARERLEEAGGAAAEADVDPDRALAETDLFVRYRSRSRPTLADVAEGADPEEVRSNVHLDQYTQFEAEDATVEGRPYEEFVRETLAYQFAEWLVEEFLFEVRETGADAALSDLYGALPEVDRIDLRGTVGVDDGESELERTFDVVLRDRMGEPLAVADLNTERDPVSGDMMDSLVDAASAVAGEGDLGGAFYVTASFFEPDALEVASEATKSGFFGRDSDDSYVKLGRNSGYHLCLIEGRGGSFYVNVPEL